MSKATHLVSGRNRIRRHTHPVQSPCHLLIVTLAPLNICTRIHLQIAFLFLIILCAMSSSKNCSDTLMASKRRTMENQYSGWFLLPSKNQTQCKWFNVGREQTDTRKKRSATGNVFLIPSHRSFCLLHSFPTPLTVLYIFALLRSDFLRVLRVPGWLWEK